MATTILSIPTSPLKNTVEALYETELRKAQNRIYNLKPDTAPGGTARQIQEKRVETLLNNTKLQTQEVLRLYTQNPTLTLDDTTLTIKIETETPVGEPDLTNVPVALDIPGLTGAGAQPANWRVNSLQSWQELTENMWLHWNHGTLILTSEEPERGKKLITPAPNIETFIAQRIDDAVNTAVKYGVTSYKAIDAPGVA